MNARWAASLLAAVTLHAFVLFGIRVQTPAHPLAISDEPASMDVSLVTTAPEAPAPPSPSPPPEPAPTPEPPAPQRTPDMSTPPPIEPTPAPEEETIPESAPVAPRPHSSPRHLVQGPPRPPSPHSGASGAAPGGSSHAGPIGPPSSRASYLSNPRPDYPGEARLQHQQGLVILSVEVAADGRADNVTMTRTSGFPLLDQAALNAVRAWRFEPAHAAGLPVPSQVDVPIRFTLSQ
jgi:protein TonB